MGSEQSRYTYQNDGYWGYTDKRLCFGWSQTFGSIDFATLELKYGGVNYIQERPYVFRSAMNEIIDLHNTIIQEMNLPTQKDIEKKIRVLPSRFWELP